MLGSFWDFSAPFYDLAQKANGRAFGDMLKVLTSLVPDGATVLEVAAGTGEISLAISNSASEILCTDISHKMLAVARKKASKQSVQNIIFDNINIFDTGKTEGAYDVVIASQVLHLIDNPENAAAELRRVAKDMVILPLSLTKDLQGMAKAKIGLYRLFGFAPKVEFDVSGYKEFVRSIGFDDCDFIQVAGKIPMTVAVWHKKHENIQA